MPFWSLEPCSRGICTTIQEGFKLPGPEWVKLEPCMADDDSVQVSNADSDPLQCCVQTLAPKRRMAILCLEAERTDDTRFNLWLGPSVPSFHFHLWMNKVLCLSGCFGPSESGNPLSESPHSYPRRWPLSVGPKGLSLTWEGKNQKGPCNHSLSWP